MNICILTNEYHTEKFKAGGMGRRMGKTAGWLAANGHVVVVCVLSESNETFDEADNLTVHRFKPAPQLRWRLRQWCRKNVPHQLRLFEESRTAAQVVTELMKTRNFEVIFTANTTLGFHLACDPPVPMIYSISSYWPICAVLNFERNPLWSPEGWLADWMVRTSIRRAAYAYAPSHLVSDMMTTLLERKIDVIRTPMDLLVEPAPWDRVRERFGLPENFIFFNGTLQGVKGVHILANAMEEIYRKYPDLHIVLAGRDRNPPDDSESMSAYFLKYARGFEERVHILPPVDHPELFAMVRQSKFLVAPSMIDNLPNTVMEAMALETMVLGTTESSIDEIITDGEEGILVRRGAINDLIDGLCRALDLSPEERTAMGRRARQKVEEMCDPDRVMATLVERLEQVAGASGPGSCSLKKGDGKLLWPFLRVNRWGASKKDLKRFQDLAFDVLCYDEVQER
ncbi:MAG: glycosyltransferase family 4 protein [Verrucomicrobiota bacterium]